MAGLQSCAYGRYLAWADLRRVKYEMLPREEKYKDPKWACAESQSLNSSPHPEDSFEPIDGCKAQTGDYYAQEYREGTQTPRNV